MIGESRQRGVLSSPPEAFVGIDVAIAKTTRPPLSVCVRRGHVTASAKAVTCTSNHSGGMSGASFDHEVTSLPSSVQVLYVLDTFLLTSLDSTTLSSALTEGSGLTRHPSLRSWATRRSSSTTRPTKTFG